MKKSHIKFCLNQKLINMARFRNIIAHDYENLDFGIIYDILQNHLQDVKDFLLVVKGTIIKKL